MKIKIIVALLISFLYSCDLIFLDSEKKEEIGKVIQIQEDAYKVFEDALNDTYDTLAALAEAVEVIQEYENVNWAQTNTQGIAIQYTNGMRGGIMVNGQDYPDIEIGIQPPAISANINTNKSIDSIYGKSVLLYENKPTGKKTIFINPHNYERVAHANNILTQCDYFFPRCGYEVPERVFDSDVKISTYTNLDKYGIVHIYAHGWAWPNQDAITDVYLMTGERANNFTTKKYWDEIKTGNIPLVLISNHSTKYFVSPDFVNQHNDFSKNNSFIYGGFCYSYLGGWPETMIDDANALAYTGFSWSVYTSWNARWAQFLYNRMGHTSAPQPMTLDNWFSNNDIAKRYWNNSKKKWVTIHYNGQGNTVFWKPVQIIPETMDGETGVEYEWEVEYASLPQQYMVDWDFGDGNKKTLYNDKKVKHTYEKSGSFQITAKLYDTSSLQQVGEGIATATIGGVVGGDSESFSFTWTYLTSSSWPKIYASCMVAGTVEGLDGNKIKSITQRDYGSVDFEFSEYGPFRITFNSSFSLNPLKYDTTYASGSSAIFTIESGSGMKWYTSTFDPYTFQATSDGVFENDECFGSISIWGWQNTKLEQYDSDNKLEDTHEGPSTFPLMSLNFNKE